MPPTISARLSGHITLDARADGSIAACFDGHSVDLGKFSAGAVINAQHLRTGLPLTSFASDGGAVDKEIDNTLYAVAGYRVCGERAVRVDMLERLADIIRPALAWRAGAPGIKPAAAFDGTGCFSVVVGMTSLVGCAGEDFAAILRSLGPAARLACCNHLGAGDLDPSSGHLKLCQISALVGGL